MRYRISILGVKVYAFRVAVQFPALIGCFDKIDQLYVRNLRQEV